ncbi:MAG: sugar phosphate isomerase/epimerase [Planctomycetaceae bacterium]|nr:sugar phosphate isomerase/epimerase [Planctomycetaceae bacterium]
MFSLGFVSAILPEQSLSEVLDIAQRIGYDCVEVMCWPVGKADRRYAGVTHIDVTNLTDAKVAEIQREVSNRGVQISGLGYYPNALSPNPEESATAVAQIRRVMEATAALGLTRFNTFVGRDWTRTVDDNWPRFLDTWGPLVELAEKLQINIGIENCPMIFGTDEWPGGKNLAHSPGIWRRMFRDLPSPRFGLNFDPSHLVWLQMDYLNPLREFASRISHVHAKDVRVDRHLLNEWGILAFPKVYHTPKLPGTGDVDWGKFFSVLGDAGYRGPVCVEVEDRIFEGSVENRIRALQQSYNYLRQYIAAGT